MFVASATTERRVEANVNFGASRVSHRLKRVLIYIHISFYEYVYFSFIILPLTDTLLHASLF
mgnify:CR=1 FL=1